MMVEMLCYNCPSEGLLLNLHHLPQLPCRPIIDQDTAVRRHHRKPVWPLGECLGFGTIGQGY